MMKKTQIHFWELIVDQDDLLQKSGTDVSYQCTPLLK